MMPFPLRSLLVGAAVSAGAVVSFGCMRSTATAVAAVPQTGEAPIVVAPAGVTPTGTLAAPTLVVFITVDQLRGDYPTRWPGQLTKGIARLTKGGAWFTNGFQDHAITETAPGHASTMSGRFPASTGIAANSIGVMDPSYELLIGAGNEPGASPTRFNGTTLYDWLEAKDPKARALSVSMKDRGAILPIGISKQDIYWYSVTGSFTTSNYYRDTLPAWVQQFNARRLPQSYAGKEWALTRDASFYKERDDVPNEKGGRDFLFPHKFGNDSAQAASAIRTSPMIDSITALFALEGLQRLELGRGPHADVMAVSFSATDYVGHSYGPDSREVHENLLRLDETIGWFIDSLYKLRDSSSIVIALTGDHGVSPIPELARDRGEATGKEGLRVNLRDLVAATRAGLMSKKVSPENFIDGGELIGINLPAFRSARVNADSVLNAFARAALRVPGVARVDRMEDIKKANFDKDPIARRWAHQVPDNLGIDLVITLTKYSYWGNSIATHGSPYDQDAFVPIIFYGAGVKPGQYSGFTRTVDMAPTLAAILNVKPMEKLDGRVLTEAIAK
jgi:predicted AlkP superfamily pyrophosphatase or phosphodiesterase